MFLFGGFSRCMSEFFLAEELYIYIYPVSIVYYAKCKLELDRFVFVRGLRDWRQLRYAHTRPYGNGVGRQRRDICANGILPSCIHAEVSQETLHSTGKHGNGIQKEPESKMVAKRPDCLLVCLPSCPLRAIHMRDAPSPMLPIPRLMHQV